MEINSQIKIYSNSNSNSNTEKNRKKFAKNQGLNIKILILGGLNFVKSNISICDHLLANCWFWQIIKFFDF